ncbi:MAG: hypothetical protein HY287_13610 [Planctomycetes bacterium]|nr:hypothetical protein [Planctomycetota bacterium]MBI3835359.1 hypothetical protein [Planctomycetota bacterium]
MSRQTAIFLTVVSSFFVTLSALGAGEVTVSLVPSHPPPFYSGEQLTLYVWLYSSASQDVRLSRVQLDFAQSSPTIELVAPFVFEYPPGFNSGYQQSNEPPVVWESLTIECGCPGLFLPLPAGGSIRAGHIDIILPAAPGNYPIDVMNAMDPDLYHGAWLDVWYTTLGPEWRAHTGELVGGMYSFNVAQAPQIPALSWSGAAQLTALIIACGAVVLSRRRRCFTLPSAFLAFVLASGKHDVADATPAEVALSVDSGSISAPGSGSVPEVHTYPIPLGPDVFAMRLHFSQVQLSGSSAAGNESFVKITSAHDGYYQILHSEAFTDWNKSTAYFNGNYVTVELYVYPGTGANRIQIDYALVEPTTGYDLGYYSRDLCGSDDRQASFDPRVARLHVFNSSAGTGVCTAFLFGGHAGHFITAGHCCNLFEPSNRYRPTIEFHVPLSNWNGAQFFPSPLFQYVVDVTSVACGPGPYSPAFCLGSGDWCVFAAFPNRMTGFYPLQERGASYSLISTLPAVNGQELRISGFGYDDTPPGSSGLGNEDNYTNQSAVGPYVSLSTTTFNYAVDTMVGDSGSPVEDMCGHTYGIHTNSGCNSDPNSSNSGWRIDESNLQSALANLQGTAATDCNENGIADHCDISCTGCSTPCGGSSDCNHNGIPDECESQADCNSNGVKDICDVYAGTVPDCNHNGVPDSCDIAFGMACDCNGNGVPDTCDICAGTSTDTNGNWVPDSCEPLPTVACCLPERLYECDVLTQCDCNAGAGITLGSGSCSATGACCEYGGSCDAPISECDCLSNGGTFLGLGHSCSTGVCCGYNGGSCSASVTECECSSGGGTFLGSGHSCTFTGACCGYDGGGCTSSVTECACIAHGGYHWQPTTSCRFVNCSIYGPEGGGDGP